MCPLPPLSPVSGYIMKPLRVAVGRLLILSEFYMNHPDSAAVMALYYIQVS